MLRSFVTVLDSKISAADSLFNEKGLRGAKTDDTEERGGVVDIVKKLQTKKQIRSWFAAEHSDDFILNALKLKGLTQDQLKKNPTYEAFGEVKVEKWLKENTPLNTVWSNLGLAGLTREEAKANAALDTFLKYVIEYDDKAHKAFSKLSSDKFQSAAKPVVDLEEWFWIKQILNVKNRDVLYTKWLSQGMPSLVP
ncbi:unnamed protein product [Phytophthora lilii]|uniref:Unnamed protein product n=1 Tax=Phytophthora lilii TaxID=2077276 RepID=A0A9W7CNL3_9STRA|nr:unnamed protein product [Phytophthora lilii]